VVEGDRDRDDQREQQGALKGANDSRPVAGPVGLIDEGIEGEEHALAEEDADDRIEIADRDVRRGPSGERRPTMRVSTVPMNMIPTCTTTTGTARRSRATTSSRRVRSMSIG
jgi:hypothetical protein